jgi:hypothetical protein
VSANAVLLLVGMRVAAALPLLLALAACNDGRAQDPAPAPAAPATTPKPAAASFGQPITVGAPTSLVDIAKTPGAYKGKTIATEGTVTRVCQERGCWMAIQDDSGTATVRMHGHTFFVPTASSGKHARVQGTVVLMKDGRECDDMASADAQLEIDATGVELM